MTVESIQSLVGNTDIYLLDQILKERYKPKEKILDAGCGEGRNLHWFLNNNFQVYGVDQNESFINKLRNDNPNISKNNFEVAAIDKLSFKDNFFNHIISSAVLHFAFNHDHFKKMFNEMIRVLKPGGTIFIRMTTIRGLEHLLIENETGVYSLPDGTKRYLLTLNMLNELMQNRKISFAEPFKTVIVDDKRSMCVLLLRKELI